MQFRLKTLVLWPPLAVALVFGTSNLLDAVYHSGCVEDLLIVVAHYMEGLAWLST